MVKSIIDRINIKQRNTMLGREFMNYAHKYGWHFRRMHMCMTAGYEKQAEYELIQMKLLSRFLKSLAKISGFSLEGIHAMEIYTDISLTPSEDIIKQMAKEEGIDLHDPAFAETYVAPVIGKTEPEEITSKAEETEKPAEALQHA